MIVIGKSIGNQGFSVKQPTIDNSLQKEDNRTSDINKHQLCDMHHIQNETNHMA
jgi:hypothetical protein